MDRHEYYAGTEKRGEFYYEINPATNKMERFAGHVGVYIGGGTCTRVLVVGRPRC